MKYVYTCRNVISVPTTIRMNADLFELDVTREEAMALDTSNSSLVERIAIVCAKKGWNEGFVAQMLNANDKFLTEAERKAIYAKMTEFNNRSIALEAQALVDAGTLVSQIVAEEAPAEKKPAPKKGK